MNLAARLIDGEPQEKVVPQVARPKTAEETAAISDGEKKSAATR